MRIAGLLVLVFGIMLLPAIGQIVGSEQSIVRGPPILYTATLVSPLEWGLPSALPLALTYVSPVVPSPVLAERNLEPLESRRVQTRSMEWRVSLLALIAAHSADAATSWNKRELNPVLSPSSGAFGLQTLAIKCAISIGSIGLQFVLLKRRPELAKLFARMNFVESGVLGATALHNSFVPCRQN